MSAPFSPIMMVGALVLQEGTRGMAELSPQTRRPSRPRYLEVEISHSHGIAAHLAGADRMMVGLSGIGRHNRTDHRL